ncbi:hypothetical protein AJ78_07027 [Emergomyces pasteurianus Ep9510]|uniref:Annexin n=1 Tax=Emergomyces pasteurianus Ep9510 TaxID=1447872 RepID=A0A1J9Q862_9EURO|nr:hypothetical protein AJ78_07027 [Emergomyces pasteurianus Ep9510]
MADPNAPGPNQSSAGHPPPPQHGQYPPQQYGAPPPQGFPPQGAPPPGAPAYGAPPPLQGQYQYPPYGQYPPQSPYPPQQGQYPPQGQYPSQYQPQPYPQQYQQPQAQYQYQQPPYGYPPQPPPAGYNAQQPAAPGYGVPPPGQNPSLQPNTSPGTLTGAPPSIGYIPGQMSPHDLSSVADRLRAAMERFSTNQNALIEILSKADPLEIERLKDTFAKKFGSDLKEDIKSKTSANFKTVLVALVHGPLKQDVHALREAVKGAGTDEAMLNDVLLGRSNADIRAIKTAYAAEFTKRTLEADVRGDLSGDVKALFNIILTASRAEENEPILPDDINRAVKDIRSATATLSSDAALVGRVFARHSNAQLRAIKQQYDAQYKTVLERTIKSKFSGHMQEALLAMLQSAVDPIKRDVEGLENAMKGWGTKDGHLIERLVRIHWDKARLAQVKAMYKSIYYKELSSRIKGETSGHYRSALLAIAE